MSIAITRTSTWICICGNETEKPEDREEDPRKHVEVDDDDEGMR